MKQIVLLCAGIMLSFQLLNAQNSEADYKQVVTIDPVLALLGSVHTEYDIMISNSVSAGISSWIEYRDIKDNWVHVRILYHIGEQPFNGWGFGLTAGWHQSKSDKPDKKQTDSSPVAGLTIEHNWLFGEQKRILVGTGIGMEFMLKKLDGNSPLPNPNGNLRLVTGWLF